MVALLTAFHVAGVVLWIGGGLAGALLIRSGEAPAAAKETAPPVDKAKDLAGKKEKEKEEARREAEKLERQNQQLAERLTVKVLHPSRPVKSNPD